MAHRSGMAALAIACLLLVGCAADGVEERTDAAPRIIQPGAPGEPNREMTPEELEELAAELQRYTEADVAFMQGMIAHHVQALRMTRMVPSRTAREDVPLFAQRMDLSQEDEIALMRRWLEERGEEVPSLLAAHEHGDGDVAHEGALMPGMLTEDELAELEAATGEEFDRLFLESMIRHHLGALQMVDELWAADGGVEPEIARFAQHVYADQGIELSRMGDMLAAMEADAAAGDDDGAGDDDRAGGGDRVDEGGA
jgi:uncharacterized protein (DUF305 family)